MKEAPPFAKRGEASNLMLMLARRNTRRTNPTTNPSKAVKTLHQIGVLERSDHNSNRDKSQGGSTRYPLICVAYGNCMDKGELSNLWRFLQAKGGEICPK